MGESILAILNKIDDVVWGLPLIILIIAVGIYLTYSGGFLQIRHLGKAFRYIVKNEVDGEGEVTSFGALCTALSATIGTGNIVGVATAIAAGGPGALFWMGVAALLGMATKFTEAFLAVKYRKVDKNNHVLGGPFYYIENGMGKKWIWLAKMFAFFGALAGIMGIGTITQINGITSAVQNFFDPSKVNTVSFFGTNYSITVIISGIIVTVCAGLVIIGGLRRIAKVAEVIVPFMAVLYVSAAVILLICNITKIPNAIYQIFVGAFNPAAVSGGVIGTMFVAMQKGIARGIFSNESGLGSAPIAAAAAQTKEPVRQGLISMTGTFIDTIIICTMTGLAIVLAGSWVKDLGFEGVEITNHAFQTGLPFPNEVSSFILMICLIFFAFTTILGWDYYSERCVEYLSKGKKTWVSAFRWLYVAAVFIGPYLAVKAVWVTADIFNALMAFPNLIALIALAPVMRRDVKEYFDRNPN